MIDPDEIDLVQPMWEKLIAHHAGLCAHFSADLRARRFEARKSELLGQGRALHLQIAVAPGASDAVGYCISSILPKGEGEIDSMFVEESYRGRGVGTEFMRRALAWLDERGAVIKTVSVLYHNDPALRFYARFGFQPRTTNLVQVKS